MLRAIESCGSPIEKVVSGGYCIGCGACAVLDPSHVRIEETKHGLYQAYLGKDFSRKTEEVCPFASQTDESDIGRRLYGGASRFDKRIGFYEQIFAGHVSESNFRENGSSGGLVTWICTELYKLGLIDGVIHVGVRGETGKGIFGYRVSDTLEDITSASRSRYYPVHFDDALEIVRSTAKRYAFVGVPCFVKAIRLLMLSDPILEERIPYCIAIFCGHMKSKGFAELIGWQQGVSPPQLKSVDFRVKNCTKPANNYSVSSTSCIGSREVTATTPVRSLYGMDWGLGYFKPKACDWCDDIIGETADVSCGDAWLPQYVADARGTNIFVVRNREILKVLQDGQTRSALALNEENVEQVYISQAGNFRHRQEGLAVRIDNAAAKGIWHPSKRIDQSQFNPSDNRRKLYLLREQLSQRSHEAFVCAKSTGSLSRFVLAMLPLEIRYYVANRNFMREVIRTGFRLLRLLTRRLNRRSPTGAT